MSKKIVSLIMAGVLVFSLVGCGKDKEKEQATPKVAAVTFEEKYDNLEGPWATNIKLEEAETKFKDLLKKMEDQTKVYGLKYQKEDIVKETEDGLRIGDSFIYLDNEKPEKNKLESLYFGMKTFGEQKEAGQIQLKVSLNFDGEGALKDGKFNFGETSLAKYSSVFTGIENRDFKDINAKILETLKSESGEGVIESSIDGLYEELTVSKNTIVYRLETRKYDFKKAAADDPTNLEKKSQ